MPLWVPKKGIWRVENNMGTVGSATAGTSVTTGASATVKGTTTQLIASTGFDAYGILVMAMNLSGAVSASEGCMDILIGAATEDVLIPNLLCGNAGNLGNAGRGPRQWFFPLYIPAGSRLSAAAASALTATAMRVGIWLFGGDGYPPWRVGNKVVTYGMSGTLPIGTAITPGASGAVGTYTQIAASTSEDHFAFLPSFQVNGDTTMQNRDNYVEIGVGAATEETIGGWHFTEDANETMDGPYPCLPVFQDVPSGTRLALRASASGTLDSGYNAVIHAMSA